MTKPNENVLKAHKRAVGVKMVRVLDPMLWKPADEKKIEQDRKDAENWAKNHKIKIYPMGSAVAI